MSGFAEYSQKLINKYKKKYKVPIVVANDENIKKYGRLIKTYDEYLLEDVIIKKWPKTKGRAICIGTGTGGGITEGYFKFWKDGNYYKSKNESKNESYISGVLTNNQTIITREANYHPDSSQVFYPLINSPYILLLALPGDDVKLEKFIGFYFDGKCGIHIFPDVWHQPIFPINGIGKLKNKQGSVHACVKVDILEEFKTWLEIDITSCF